MYCAICWIKIYPINGVIHLSNNQGMICNISLTNNSWFKADDAFHSEKSGMFPNNWQQEHFLTSIRLMIRLQDNLHHEKLIFNFNSMVECSGFIFLPNHATIHITFAQKNLQFSQSFLCSTVWSQYDVKKWRRLGFAGEINGSKLSQYDGWCCQGGSCSVSCQVSQSIHTGICSRNWSKRVQ